VFEHLRWMQESADVVDGSQIDQDDHVFTVMSMRELLDGAALTAHG
jgi:hypothetical protein